MNRLVEEADGTVRLYVGAENWPMPVPLTHKGDVGTSTLLRAKMKYCFAASDRTRWRPVQIMQELVAAEKEYYSQSCDGEPKQYTQSFFSDGNKRDGLFWQTAGGGTTHFHRVGPRYVSAVSAFFSHVTVFSSVSVTFSGGNSPA